MTTDAGCSWSTRLTRKTNYAPLFDRSAAWSCLRLHYAIPLRTSSAVRVKSTDSGRCRSRSSRLAACSGHTMRWNYSNKLLDCHKETVPLYLDYLDTYAQKVPLFYEIVITKLRKARAKKSTIVGHHYFVKCVLFVLRINVFCRFLLLT